jgi:long-chain acyl-CoA synthetase
MLAAGVTIAYGRGVDTFARDAEALRPTILIGVPRLFEQIRGSVREAARGRGRTAASLFRFAEAAAARRGRHAPNRPPRPGLFDPLWERLFFRPLRERLGGQVRWMVSGSAPLGRAEALFFRGAGLPLLEGYGLSEAGPIVSVNRPDRWKFGTVGPPLEGVEIRIAEDGEILGRSPSVMKGYLGLQAETRETIQGGWLHTGDLGGLDAEGFLRITGRKKDLIVTSGGKNISPNVIEEKLRARPFIQQAVVFGDRRPYLVALLVADRAAVDVHAASHGRAAAELRDSGAEGFLRSLLRKQVDAVNHELAPHERVRSFDLLPEPPSIEAGTLTPTLKVRRAMLEAVHAERIAALYDGRRR